VVAVACVGGEGSAGLGAGAALPRCGWGLVGGGGVVSVVVSGPDALDVVCGGVLVAVGLDGAAAADGDRFGGVGVACFGEPQVWVVPAAGGVEPPIVIGHWPGSSIARVDSPRIRGYSRGRSSIGAC
jgi:hypothetical protein